MTPERQARMAAVAARRQPDLTVFCERVHKPHNFAAILRTCDAVGIMEAHAVPPTGGLPALNHTSQGAQRWVDVRRHPDAASGIAHLRERGFRLIAAHLTDRAVDFRAVDYTRPVAVVLGTEKFGVDSQVLAACDDALYIPMAGMAQSLNVSVAAAVALYHARSDRLRRQGHHADLSEAERTVLRARFCMRSVRDPEALLRRALQE